VTRGSAPEDTAPLECAFAYASPNVQLVLPLQLRAGATAQDARDAARASLAAGEAAWAAIEASGATLAVQPAVIRVAGSPTRAALAEIPWDGGECAIFGQAVGWDRPLQPGERVDLLRPLQADPRVSRRRRVAEARRQAAQPTGRPPRPQGG
jgi:putative ubiquitin-RnfH superfamily antitoxin RatB of RatAB toxin-antitoxin module